MTPSIWELVNTALSGLGVPVVASAYLASTPGLDLPATYIAFMLIDMSPEEFADDEETLRSELVQVSVRSRSGLAALPDVIGAMKTAGFMFSNGRELDYDSDSRHFGVAFDFEYLRDLGE